MPKSVLMIDNKIYLESISARLDGLILSDTDRCMRKSIKSNLSINEMQKFIDNEFMINSIDKALLSISNLKIANCYNKK